MSEWELRLSQKEIHRMHVVRLTIEGRETETYLRVRSGLYF